MIKLFRLKLTIYFVVLSCFVYILIAGAALAFFSGVQTKSLDDRVYMLASEVGHAIDLDTDKEKHVPKLRQWHRVVTTNPARGLASALLCDPDGNILESFGPDCLHKFYKHRGEVIEDGQSYRVYFTPLRVSNEIVGYVQVNTSTSDRDHAIQSLLFTLCLAGPLVVLGLGLTSYYVSGIAAEPLLKNVLSMRRFIEDAGHELNTPLSIVRAKSETLERKLETLGLPVEELDVCLRSVGRMEKIVSDLMYLTELDTEPISDRFELIDIQGLFSELLEDFKSRFEERQLQLKIAATGPINVKGQPDLLYRALANLTENALRYTDKGLVEINAVVEHGEVVINIVDTGIGIPEDSRRRIFERFYRVDKSRSRASGGVGLGLSIVKAIVDAHRGTIAVDSETGKGTRFTLIFPAA